MYIDEAAAYRAYTKWIKDDNGCYISTYSLGSHGRPQVGWQAGGKTQGTTAARAAWVHVHGQIHGTMDVDHRPECDRRCVKVDHLRLITPSQNRRRNFSDFPLEYACERNHPESSRVLDSKGSYACRECKNEKARESHAAFRAENPVGPHWRTLLTECKLGHPLDGLRTRPDGSVIQRYCKTCNYASSRRSKLKHRVVKPPRFTPEQIAAIRSDTRAARDVAADYDTSHTTILRIRK